MWLNDYQFLYNASAYFAARERYGAEERARVEAYALAADEDAKRTPEYRAELERLQTEADAAELVSLLGAQSQAGFEALCWAVAELTAQGELWRRHMGHEPRELLTPERVRVELRPYQISEAKALVMDAIVRGIQPPRDESAEVDEVLEALQKKTGSP